MKYKQPSFTWHPEGAKERPGLVLLLVGIVCFVAGALIGNLDAQRDTVLDLTAAAAIIDSAASDNTTGAPRIVAPPAAVESAGVQRPPKVKQEPERVAAPPPPIAITSEPAPALPARRAKIVETRPASSLNTPTPTPPIPTVRRIERRVQSSSADYLSLRRSILQQ